MLKSALLMSAAFVLGAGAVQGIHAASGPASYSVYEATVKDEAAYAKDLPEVATMIKEHHGERLAGGFNKAKANFGQPAAGNRYVIIKFDSAADQEAFWEHGGKAWVEKHAPDARNVVVEEAK
jgi:uncharacterized protein (DUF1330 family)